MKIFFNDRHILLADKSEALLAYRMVDTYKDAESLRGFVERFMADEGQENACIVADDVQELEAAFLSLYPVVSAAGGLIHNGDDEYLVIDRKGYSDLPKGKAEQGEGPIETATREVEEETGLQGLNVIDLIDETYHTYTEHDGTFVIKRTVWFSMSVPGRPKLTPQTDEGITSARWVSRAQLKEEAKKAYESLKEIFLSVK